MKRAKLPIIILAGVILLGLSFTVGMLYERSQPLQEQLSRSVPSTTQDRYEELTKDNPATMEACVENISGKVVYAVSTIGFEGDTYFYEADGSSMGTHHYSDIDTPDAPQPPVDLPQDYSCITLKDSSIESN